MKVRTVAVIFPMVAIGIDRGASAPAFIEEKDDEGMQALLGKKVQIWCMNYIYSGRLVGVNEHDLKLEDPHVVYETGKLSEKGFADAQPFLAKYHYVRLAAVESYGEIDD